MNLVHAYVVAATMAFLTIAEAGPALEEALVKDLFGSLPSSSRCKSSKSSGQFKFSFEHTPYVDDQKGYKWDKQYGAERFEKQVFLAELEHIDSNPDLSWKIRIGHGGNIYSFIGAFGESVAPQKHSNAPFIDEVWQMVAVAQPAERKCTSSSTAKCKWFIHQAGTYTKDSDLKNKPFYSPSVAKYCNYQRRECGFISWGQQAHVPTPFSSAVLYYTRYRDCGNGVLEVTSGFHNAGNSKSTIDYNNVPWGGVRFSTLKSVVLTRKDGVEHSLPEIHEEHLLPPSNEWGSGGLYNHRDYGGYSTFAENLPVSAAPFDPLCIASNGNQVKAGKDGKCPSGSSELVFKIAAKAQWSPKPSRIRVKIANFKTAKWGCPNCNLQLSNGKKGAKAVFITGVAHWTWADGFMYFFPEKGVTPNVFNAAIKVGETLRIANRDTGKPFKQNLALSVVYGINNKDRVRLGSSPRDYTVWTVNALGKRVAPGSTLSARQFFAAGDYLGMHDRVQPLIAEAKVKTNPHAGAGQLVIVYSAEGSTEFGVRLKDNSCAAAVRCTGLSAPKEGHLPLFAVTCGSKSYVGSNPYYFTPSGVYRKPWRCDGQSVAVRPTWTLLGYFQDGACKGIATLQYSPGYCPTSTSTPTTSTTKRTTPTTSTTKPTTPTTSTTKPTTATTSTTKPTSATTSTPASKLSSGLKLKDENASILFGQKEDVEIKRKGDGQLLFKSDLVVGGLLNAKDIVIDNLSLKEHIKKIIAVELDKK